MIGFCFQLVGPRPGGSLVSVSGRTHDLVVLSSTPQLRRLFFSVYFRLPPLQKYVGKVVGGFGKKTCVRTGVRKPRNRYSSPTTMI